MYRSFQRLEKASKVQGDSFPRHTPSSSNPLSCKAKAALAKTSAAIVGRAIAYLQRSKLDRAEQRCEARYETNSQAHSVLFRPVPCKKRKQKGKKRNQVDQLCEIHKLAFGPRCSTEQAMCAVVASLYILAVYGQLVLYE
ncbi:hypothetical protein LZ32DRAFT_159026 [Colletotrichum eremochloae]|nr:hypothetical protein LZ32DRAFT_159026 [Colletotrichum eremochloae]